MTAALTIGITTRNRPQSLAACLVSLAVVADLDPEVLVFDDGSSPAADAGIARGVLPVQPRFIRDESAPGYITGRNRLVREASAPCVLLLDDDARLMSAASVLDALRVLRSDPRVAAVALAQAEVDGRPWPAAMQPSHASIPSLVPTFIGFAHMIRRDVFLEHGGYREAFEFYGEEKDFGLRLLEAGYHTVYLPGALVVHAIDPAGRDSRRHLRFVARNDCLMALYNDPFFRLLWMLPARYALYFRMRRAWKVNDPWGWAWLAGNLLRRLPGVWRERKPVSRATLATWAALRRNEVPYTFADPPPAHAHAADIHVFTREPR